MGVPNLLDCRISHVANPPRCIGLPIRSEVLFFHAIKKMTFLVSRHPSPQHAKPEGTETILKYSGVLEP